MQPMFSYPPRQAFTPQNMPAVYPHNQTSDPNPIKQPFPFENSQQNYNPSFQGSMPPFSQISQQNLQAESSGSLPSQFSAMNLTYPNQQVFSTSPNLPPTDATSPIDTNTPSKTQNYGSSASSSLSTGPSLPPMNYPPYNTAQYNQQPDGAYLSSQQPINFPLKTNTQSQPISQFNTGFPPVGIMPPQQQGQSFQQSGAPSLGMSQQQGQAFQQSGVPFLPSASGMSQQQGQAVQQSGGPFLPPPGKSQQQGQTVQQTGAPFLPPAPGMSPAGQKAPSARSMADNMPSAVEVIANDRVQRAGVFKTGQPNVAPPLSTTDFACQDDGNCNPRFIRSSLYTVPISADSLKSVGLSFILTCQPFSRLHPEDKSIMLCDMGPQGPVRCVRCKAYMSPFITFIDGGRRFQCPLCCASTDVPEDYFAHLDHTGRRVDTFQRPELYLGSYDIIATKEYCRNDEFPLSPAYIFLLDVSQAAIRSGLVSVFCSRFITEILPALPRDEHSSENTSGSPISIGFITYDNQLHFYNIVRPNTTPGGNAQCLAKPQMNVVADTGDVFVPSVEGFLAPAEPAIITNLLSAIPSHFLSSAVGSANPDPVLGPAIQAGLEALKAANRSGKLFILHSSLPTAEAPGVLKFREDRHVIGTDREKSLLQPATDFYTNLGKQCVEAGCGVDLFLFPNSYVDVATISEVSRLTSGNVFKYSCFQADLQGDQFISDLRKAVAMPVAFNAVMRIRTSTGTRPCEFFGNFNLPNTTDVELATVDYNSTITCEIRHDDKLLENDLVFIQAAVLYTSVSGSRRIRVHNLSLSTSSNPSEIFRLADLDALTTWLSKLAVQSCYSKSSTQITTDLTNKVAQALTGYRRLCTGGPQGASPGELVLPETIKLLPLYVQSLMKLDAIRPARNSTIDDRSLMMLLLNGMGPRQTIELLYPRILPLHNLDPQCEDLPMAIRCSYERLDADGAYLIENGFLAVIWLGQKVDPLWIQKVFSVNDVLSIEMEKATLVEHENPTSHRVFRLVSLITASFTNTPRLRIIRQGELSEAWVKRLMCEDRDDVGNPSYVEYLCHIHKEVRALLK